MSIQANSEQLQRLSDCLLDGSGKTPLHERFRALFTLKAIGGDEVVDIVAAGKHDLSVPFSFL
jgi:deoxyhypusine monooxygenase